MSGETLLLTERFRRIRVTAEIADLSQRMAENATSNAVRDANWSAHDSAVAGLLGLICSDEGKQLMDSMLARLEGRA